nr:adhesion G protein-coupled receptor E1-like [Ciona intestinalis]|eukprot:XP_002120639.2 adhesion G protein-coupled receptor E1-like [Ciona intestinalis]
MLRRLFVPICLTILMFKDAFSISIRVSTGSDVILSSANQTITRARGFTNFSVIPVGIQASGLSSCYWNYSSSTISMFDESIGCQNFSSSNVSFTCNINNNGNIQSTLTLHSPLTQNFTLSLRCFSSPNYDLRVIVKECDSSTTLPFGSKPAPHAYGACGYNCKRQIQCIQGYTGTPVTSTCTYNATWSQLPNCSIDHCSGQTICGENTICLNVPNKNVGYTCKCKAGYVFVGDGVKCADIDECQIDKCHPMANCTNMPGSYNCTCFAGFTGDGFTCTDINECVVDPTICLNSECNNTIGSYICSGCRKGFANNGFSVCVDINECISNPCPVNTMCSNTVGSFICQCNPGFIIGTNSTCILNENPCLGKNCASNATCHVLETALIPESFDYDFGSGDRIATCICDPGFGGLGEISCTNTCSFASFSIGGVMVSFNFTFTSLTAYSNERCASGYPIASILCGVQTEPGGGSTVQFLESSVSFTDCNFANDIQTAIEQVNITNVTATQIEEVLTELDLITSVPEIVSDNDTNNVVNFISSVTMLAGEGDIQVTENIYQKVVSIADHITTKIQLTSPAGSETSLLSSLDSLGFQVDVSTTQFNFLTENIVAQVQNQSVMNSARFEPMIYENSSSGNLIQPIRVDIPAVAIQAALNNQGISRKRRAAEENTKLVFILHRDSTLFQNKERANWVASATVGNTSVSGFSNAVNITHSTVTLKVGEFFDTTTQKTMYTNNTCVFWDFATNSWSKEGCCLIENSVPAQCSCNHLTNFALLVNVHEVPKDAVLTTVSNTGCVFSIVFLIITFVILVSFKELREKAPNETIINISINQALVFLVFILGVDLRSNTNICITSTAFLHYFNLTTWMWTAVYGYILFTAFVKIVNISIVRVTKTLYFLSYGIPIFIVGVNLGITLPLSKSPEYPPICGAEITEQPTSAFLAETHCWLHGISLYISFLLPVGLVLLLNIVIFFLVIRNITWNRKRVQSTMQKRTAGQHLLMACTLAGTLGFVWVLGYFMILSNDDTFILVMSWVFTIAATLEGVSIFFLVCVRRNDVRKLWWKPLRDNVLRPFVGPLRSSPVTGRYLVTKSKTTNAKTETGSNADIATASNIEMSTGTNVETVTASNVEISTGTNAETVTGTSRAETVI